MTGGELYLYGDQDEFINKEYITSVDMKMEDEKQLKFLLEEYVQETRSMIATEILENWEDSKSNFGYYLPKKIAENRLTSEELEA